MSDIEDSASVNLVPEEVNTAATEHANTEHEINVGDKKCSGEEILITELNNVIDKHAESLQSLETNKTHGDSTKDTLIVKNADQDKQVQLLDSNETAKNSTQSSNLNERKSNDNLENFWLENNYKKVVKRIEDGMRTIDDLSRMVQERSEIESFYGNKLKGWSTKWSEIFQRSYEYNLTYKALLRGLDEGHSLAGLQLSVSSKLDGLSKQLIQWKNDTYIKQFTKLKEVKRSEDAFAKAQKPWIQKCNEVLKCMNIYHNASGLYDAAMRATFQDASSDVTQDQKRLKDKLRKLEEEVSLTRSRYEEAIRDISNYNPKYQDDMKYEFNNCQLFEESRKNFIKESLLRYHACVNIVSNLESVYTQLKQDYEAIDVEKDNRWFQEFYGDAHPFESIKFIDYFHATPHDQIKQDIYHAKKSGVCTTL